jgi:hypothetical protein
LLEIFGRIEGPSALGEQETGKHRHDRQYGAADLG